jgi:hypothetical protein
MQVISRHQRATDAHHQRAGDPAMECTRSGLVSGSSLFRVWRLCASDPHQDWTYPFTLPIKDRSNLFSHADFPDYPSLTHQDWNYPPLTECFSSFSAHLHEGAASFEASFEADFEAGIVGEGERIEEGQDTGRADWWVGSAQLGGEAVVGGVAVGRPRPYVLFSGFFFFFGD